MQNYNKKHLTYLKIQISCFVDNNVRPVFEARPSAEGLELYYSHSICNFYNICDFYNIFDRSSRAVVDTSGFAASG